MSFSAEALDGLKMKLKGELSERRYLHTLGVYRAALSIADYFPSLSKAEIAAAALLHDVAKELPTELQVALAVSYLGSLNDDELKSKETLHALAAPGRILEKYPEFGVPSVLSAVMKHTTGDGDMTLFDKVIFVADYGEDGRTYQGCVRARETLFSSLSMAGTVAECGAALNRACLLEIDDTLRSLDRRGVKINPKTLTARNAISSLI